MKRTAKQRDDAFHQLWIYYWKQADKIRPLGGAWHRVSKDQQNEYQRIRRRMELTGYCIRRLLDLAGWTGGDNLPPMSASDERRFNW